MKHLDKLKHLGLFALGSLAALYVISATLPMLNQLLHAGLAGLFVLVVAFLTEDAQRKQPGRVKDGWDAFADMVGFVLAVLAFGLYNQLGAA